MTEKPHGLRDRDIGESGKQEETKTSKDTQREADAERDSHRQTQRGQTAAELATLPLMPVSAAPPWFLRVLAKRGCRGPGGPCQVAGPPGCSFVGSVFSFGEKQ